MIIDLRLGGDPLRGIDESVAATSAVLRAMRTGGIDPAATRVVFDWVQYRGSFREAVAVRDVLDPTSRLGREVGIDLRQVEIDGFDRQLGAALGARDGLGVLLEPWLPLSRSCAWRFNALYWQELALWEEVAGHGYEQALPGGESSGTNLEATATTVAELIAVWDGLSARQALPEQLTILEIGVGSGEQARVFLDELRRADLAHGSNYYRRLQYLMGDYSAHVLDRARATVAEHERRVSTLVLDAARPRDTLRFLESKVFCVFVSNVYDNLPSDEVAVLDDGYYLVEGRAVLPGRQVQTIAKDLAVDPSEIGDLATRLLRLGPRLLAEWLPEVLGEEKVVAGLWRALWSAVRLEERYVPLGPLDLYEIAGGMDAELLAPLLEGHGDLRVHASNGAIGSFLDTLPLLHPLGWLVSHDLFVTDLGQYREGFRGPGKLDGSVVNWVNGPLLQALAVRRGYRVDFAPFAHRSRSPVVTALARARD